MTYEPPVSHNFGGSHVSLRVLMLLPFSFLFGRQLSEETTRESVTKQHIKTPEDVRQSNLSIGASLPALEIVKEFVRFYIHTADKSLLTKNGRPSLDSTKGFCEFFFAGFETATKTVVSKDDRSEIYTVWH